MVARRGSDGKQDSEAAAISYLSPSHRLQSAVAEALADRAGSYNETKPSDRDGVVAAPSFGATRGWSRSRWGI